MASIQAKVAEVLSENLLAINVGSDKGVEPGNTVSVRRSIEIVDPDTQEMLGSVSVIKLVLQVNHVQERLCTARVTSPQDVDSPRVPRKKRIVTYQGDEKQGISVYVAIGDRADVEIKEANNPWSDEPPF